MKYKEYDYIRTKDGIIDKVIFDYNGHCNSPDCNCKHVSCKYNYYDEDTIIKSSPNIIDLIEVGDYVNGCKIIELATNIEGKTLYLETDITEFDNVYACGNINIYEKDIRTIVTKEQFKSMEYKVGD